MDYRLFALDLDGTLLNAAGRVHAADRDAIFALRERGIAVTLVTGRLYSGTRHVAHEVDVHGAVGCADGSHLVEVRTGLDLHHGGLSGPLAARLRELVEDLCPTAFLFARDQIIHDDRGADYLTYVQTWSRDLVATSRVTDHPHWDHGQGITALVALGSESSIARAKRACLEALAEGAMVIDFPVGSDRWALMIRAAGHTKGTAITRLAEHYGIGVHQVVAVGDWWNDVPMFSVVGRSFVMAQAPAGVRDAASDKLEASAATGGGVAEAARKLGLV